MTARNRTDNHAQATRGSRADENAAQLAQALKDAEALAQAATVAADATQLLQVTTQSADAEREAAESLATRALNPADEASIVVTRTGASDDTTTQDVPTPEAQAVERADALVAVLKDHTNVEVLNALVKAHFGGSYATMLRRTLKTISPDSRNRALFTRTESDDKKTMTYDLCGYIGSITQDSSGRYRQNGFLMSARDKSGNVFEKRFGDGQTTYDNLKTPERNMLAGWRNGVIWILEERDTERVKHSGIDPAALAALEARAQAAEARALAAEARAQESAQAQADATQALSAQIAQLMERMLKSESGS